MANFDQVSLLLLVLVPLAGAALAMFLPKDRPRDAWQFAHFCCRHQLRAVSHRVPAL